VSQIVPILEPGKISLAQETTSTRVDNGEAYPWPEDREQRARIIGDWLQSEARYLA
jgi:hypothetical protein